MTMSKRTLGRKISEAKKLFAVEARQKPGLKNGTAYIHNIFDDLGREMSAKFKNGKFIKFI